MKRTIFTTTKNFRCTNHLAEAINELADQANMHPSDIIRTAVLQYVQWYRENPDATKAA